MERNEERWKVWKVRVKTKGRRPYEEHDGIRKAERRGFVFGVAEINYRCVWAGSFLYLAFPDTGRAEFLLCC